MPDGEVHRRFAHLIADLSARHGTPAFEPHVTLLGGLDVDHNAVLASSAQLAASLRPFSVSLTRAGQSDEYFRCLYVHAEPAPALLAAQARARALLGQDEGQPFVPHLSLVYGQLDQATKRGILKEIEIGSELAATFEARALEVHDTTGAPAGWHRVARLPFGGVKSRSSPGRARRPGTP